MFRTEDVADFFVNKHIGVRGKLLPFVRNAKRILKVMVKGVHPEMWNELLVSELFDYIKHVSSIRNSYRQYDGTTYCNGTRQIFVTNLARHIPRSLKTGNRWCLVFYRDQPVLHRRLPCISTIVETPNSEELRPPPLKWSWRCQGRAPVLLKHLTRTQSNLIVLGRSSPTSPCLRHL